LTWDYRNRLVEIIDKDSQGNVIQTVEYTYDVYDRRIAKTVDVNPTDNLEGIATYFIYDRENVILEFIDTDGVSGEEPVFDKRYL
jgi:YD repeat-containing protein